MSSPHDDRRRHPRRRSRERAWFESDDRAVYLKLHDISKEGLSVRAPMPFHVGDEIVVTIGDLRVRVEVRWIAGRPHAGMGCRFVEVIEGERALETLTRDPESP